MQTRKWTKLIMDAMDEGGLDPRPSGYDVTAARWQKLYRRVLPIFQKYLP